MANSRRRRDILGVDLSVEAVAVTHLDREIQSIRKALIRKGVYLRMGRDFDVFAERIRTQPARHKMLSQFDPKGDMDGAKDAFWICGFDADGELIHTQALQLHDMQRKNVARHIAETIPNYLPPRPGLEPGSIRATPGPKASKLTGDVVYHGEMWLIPELRDRGTASLVNRLGMYLAMQKWDPDSVFGLMSWGLACYGFGIRIGYLHCEPMALTWDVAGEKSQHQVWTVFMERDDLRFLLELPAVEFDRFLIKLFR